MRFDFAFLTASLSSLAFRCLISKLEKAKECTEDDVRRSEEEVQKYTDSYIKNIDTLLAAKEKELMEV